MFLAIDAVARVMAVDERTDGGFRVAVCRRHRIEFEIAAFVVDRDAGPEMR